MKCFYVYLRKPADALKLREAFPARKVWFLVSPTLLISEFTERECETLASGFSKSVTIEPASFPVEQEISA